MEEKNIIAPDAVFSEALLRFLFSVVEEENPFGLFLKRMEMCDYHNIMETAKKEGAEKGILDNEKLTEKGLVYLRILEEYHKADNYCIVNKIIAAVLPKEMMILFYLEQDMYHMKVVTVKEFEDIVVGWYPELLVEESSYKGSSQKKKISAWIEEHKIYNGKMLTIGSYSKDGIKREDIFYWNEKGTYRYQIQKEREKEISKIQILQRLRQVCNKVGVVDYV